LNPIRVQRKRIGGYKISPRREVIEQNRLRNSMERKLRLQLMTAFADIGKIASDAHEEGRDVEGLRLNIVRSVRNVMEPHYRAVMEAFGTRILRNRKADTNFERYLDGFLREVGGNRITNVSNTTIKSIRRIIVKSQENGEGTRATSKAIFEGMRGAISKRRSALIARTETHSAASYANHRMNESLEIPNQKKRWVAVNDIRSRHWHKSMDGVEVDINEDFEVVVKGVTYKMKHTGDPRGGASNVINCRCVTIYIDPDDEVVDDKPPPDKPIVSKPPEPEAIVTPPEVVSRINNNPYSSPKESGFSEATFKLVERKVAVKKLNEMFSKNHREGKLSGHYEEQRRFRGSKPKDFGNANHLNGKAKYEISDQTASYLLQVMPELDSLSDRFRVPRLRGMKRTRANDTAIMSMGDGVLNINPYHTNKYTKNIGRKINKPSPEDIAKNAKNDELLMDIGDEIHALRRVVDKQNEKLWALVDTVGAKDPTYKELYKSYLIRKNELSKRLIDRKKLVQNRTDFRERFSGDDVEPPSTWRQGDSFNEQPWTVNYYEKTKFDQMRSTLYHEMGHQIHQYWKIDITSIYPKRPLETLLIQKYTPLKKAQKGVHSISEYSRKNSKEWFAENFSAYFMDKKDLCDPMFIKLIEDLLEEIHGKAIF